MKKIVIIREKKEETVAAIAVGTEVKPFRSTIEGPSEMMFTLKNVLLDLGQALTYAESIGGDSATIYLSQKVEGNSRITTSAEMDGPVLIITKTTTSFVAKEIE